MDTDAKDPRPAREIGLAWGAEDDNSHDDLYLLSALIAADQDWKGRIPGVTTHVLAGAR